MKRMRPGKRVVGMLARVLSSRREHERMQTMPMHDAGHGYDVLGMHRAWVTLAAALLRPLHRHYFRVRSHGADHIPAQGPAILVCNHSGILPFDAAMLYVDILDHTELPRALRPVADYFVSNLPMAGTLLSRMGVASGTPSNVSRLLENGELVLIFPEGTRAIGKSEDQRYRLQDWSVGHAELALKHGVPIVPVAVLGAEEQWRELMRIHVRLLGAPYVPIPWPPFPKPVLYDIHYGAALPPTAASSQPTIEQIDALAQASKQAVERLLEDGLRQREGRAP